MLSLNNEENYNMVNNSNKNNNKTPRVNNNLAKSAVEPKKTFSGFRENRSTHNLINSENEEAFSKGKKNINIDALSIENKKLQEKVFFNLSIIILLIVFF